MSTTSAVAYASTIIPSISKSVSTQTCTSHTQRGVVSDPAFSDEDVTNDVCGECYEVVKEISEVFGGTVIIGCRCGNVHRYHWLCVHIAYERTSDNNPANHAFVTCPRCRSEIVNYDYIRLNYCVCPRFCLILMTRFMFYSIGSVEFYNRCTDRSKLLIADEYKKQ